MERHFEQELEKLNRRILKMGDLVSNQVNNAMTALIRCDAQLAREVVENDARLDELDIKIDKLCQRIFALTQPVATDLRMIMSALKINNDLERMGDLAVNIASKIEGIAEYHKIMTELNIEELANMINSIIKEMIIILNNRNTVFVKDIFADARSIRERTQIINTQIIDHMMKKTDVIIVATNLIIILTHIERLADYVTNIAESIVFLVDGKLIKHANIRESDLTENP